MKLQAFIAWVSVLLAFVSAEMHLTPYSQVAMAVSIILLSALTMISVWFDPAFRRLRRQGKFQSFMRTGVLLSFFWLFLGLFLFVLQLIVGQGYLDAATHAIALGFIGSFIVAHSPVIFPLTLKRNANQERVTFLPLIILTVSNVMRVFGDLASYVSSAGFVASYLSGYVLLIALVAFVYNLKRIMVPNRSTVKNRGASPEDTVR